MDTAEEPHFLVDDFLIEANQELEQVITALNKKTPHYYEKAKFLKNFTGNMFRAYHQKKKEWGIEEKYNTIVELKEAEKEEHIIENYIEKKSELEKIRQQEKEKIKEELIKKKEEVQKRIEILLKEEEKKIKNQDIEIPVSPNSSQKTEPTLKPITSLEEIEKTFSFSDIPSLSEIGKPAELKTQESETRENSKPSSEYKSFIEPLVSPSNKEVQENQNISEFSKEASAEYGKITNLINNQEIEEIICDGPDQSLKTVANNKEKIIELQLTDQEINDIIQLLAQKSEQKVSKENPFLMTQYKNLNIQATITTEHSQPRFVILKE